MGLEIQMKISYHIPIAKLGVRILYYIVRLSVRTFNSLLFWKLQFNETFCDSFVFHGIMHLLFYILI